MMSGPHRFTARIAAQLRPVDPDTRDALDRRWAGLPDHVRSLLESFMAASVVAPARDALERGERSVDPDVAVAQDRLRACAYAMAHPETGRLVPACVLDPAENAELRRLLPVARGRCAASDA